ncbi:hypothetical protein MMC29_001419 [Sticta canariensis]|nr:hypothetical protein [Sticta canariensis]
MRSFFFSCAVLCAIGLVGALPSAISPDSLEDKHPIGKRQDSYLTADVQQPLDGDCVISDDRTASSSTDVSNAPLLTGKWKKMGDCPSKQVQIQEFKYEYLRFNRGCCLNKPLSCNKKKLGICKNPALQNNCPHPGVWSAYDPTDCPSKKGVNTLCCTSPWLGPGEAALPINPTDQIASTIGFFPAPLENLALVSNDDGYFGQPQPQGITSPEPQTVAFSTLDQGSSDPNYWTDFSNLLGLSKPK